MTPGQFFRGSDDRAPDFENVVKVVISTFAVFVGFTITEYLKKISFGNFEDWVFWAFIALAALLLRYIIGSSVHLNYVYVQKLEPGRPQERSRSRSVLLLFKDLCFLVVFGMIAVYITKASNLDDFVLRTLWFVGAGFVWSVTDALIRGCLAGLWNDAGERPGKFALLWIALDLTLFVIVVLTNSWVTDVLQRAVVIALVYVVFLLLDFLAIIRAVQFREK
jgi:hypothetical protein